MYFHVYVCVCFHVYVCVFLNSKCLSSNIKSKAQNFKFLVLPKVIKQRGYKADFLGLEGK